VREGGLSGGPQFRSGLETRPTPGGKQLPDLGEHGAEDALALLGLRQVEQFRRCQEMLQALLVILLGQGPLAGLAPAFALGIAGPPFPEGGEGTELLKIADGRQGLRPSPLVEQPLAKPISAAAARLPAEDQPQRGRQPEQTNQQEYQPPDVAEIHEVEFRLLSESPGQSRAGNVLSRLCFNLRCSACRMQGIAGRTGEPGSVSCRVSVNSEARRGDGSAFTYPVSLGTR
jgi:hypothetical protein